MLRPLVAGRREALQVELLRALIRYGFEVDVDRDMDLDVFDREACRRAIGDARATVVIDCGAAEDHSHDEEPLDDLPIAAENLAIAAAEHGAHSVFISTGKVFGEAVGAASLESDPPTPTSPFGAAALSAERLVARLNAQHTIVRSGELYGRRWTGPFDDLLARASSVGHLTVASNPICPPTYVRYLVSTLQALVRRPVYGIVHRAATGSCNELELARAVVSLLGIDCSIEAPAEPEPATLPHLRGACLSTRREELPSIPHWRICLRAWALDRAHVDERIQP